MEMDEKHLKLAALEIALKDLDRIIATMKENNYPLEEINEYIKKRYSIWDEIFKVKSQ